MKKRFVASKNNIQECNNCCVRFLSPECLESNCHESSRKDGKTGYFIKIKTTKSNKYENLLKFMLKQFDVKTNGKDQWLILKTGHVLFAKPSKQEDELIKIKESMK